MTIVCVHVQRVSKTPLQYAAGGGHVVVVKALLAAGANVNAQIDVSAPWLGWKARVRVCRVVTRVGRPGASIR